VVGILTKVAQQTQRPDETTARWSFSEEIWT